MKVTELDAKVLAAAKRAFTTRRVPQKQMRTLVSGAVRPRTGDLVMAVVDQIGSHKRIELPTGRRAFLSPGDIIIVAYGNRYAPDQFEAVIGDDLSPCELVAAGGIAANKICKHDRMHEPTRITPLGLVGDKTGRVMNLECFGVQLDETAKGITTVFVAGTAMNAGKTFTSACLIQGFSRAGMKVAGIKSTGTGAGGDVWQMSDFGAHTVLDFTDGGLPSTYLQPAERIEKTVIGLIGHAATKGCKVAVVEIADGLHHEETAMLLQSEALQRAGRGIVFAANDALGAQAGLEQLTAWGWQVFGLSGQLTRSPLAIREAAKATGMPVLTGPELQSGALCGPILGTAGFMPKIVDGGNGKGAAHPTSGELAERIVALSGGVSSAVAAEAATQARLNRAS